MDLTERLSKHFDDLKKLYPSLIWYGKKSDLEDIDDPGAILTYTTENHGADAVPHYSVVTLSLYLTNETLMKVLSTRISTLRRHIRNE